jgi:hypothetical protein
MLDKGQGLGDANAILLLAQRAGEIAKIQRPCPTVERSHEMFDLEAGP